jgi:hypothetical protein
MDTKHRMWKHIKGDGVYQLLGGAIFRGGSGIADMGKVVLTRPAVSDGSNALDCCGETDTTQIAALVGEATVQLNKGVFLSQGDELAYYRGSDGHCWVRPAKDFFDGRFIKLDDNLQPLEATTAAPAVHALDAGKAFGKAVAAREEKVAGDD